MNSFDSIEDLGIKISAIKTPELDIKANRESFLTESHRVMRLFIALCYNLKADYIDAGFSTSEVMKFDDEQTT
ncbi:hypothetical protein [Nostoc sp.]|uniref:hypothetical protein n=1 Tax=Nostoc sp. TaxID=1180 RepID=UPI002FF6E9AD